MGEHLVRERLAEEVGDPLTEMFEMFKSFELFETSNRNSNLVEENELSFCSSYVSNEGGADRTSEAIEQLEHNGRDARLGSTQNPIGLHEIRFLLSDKKLGTNDLTKRILSWCPERFAANATNSTVICAMVQ